MGLMWYHHGNLIVTDDVVYKTGVQIGDKLYLIGDEFHESDEVNPLVKMVISELDLNTMTIEKLMFFTFQRYANKLLSYKVMAYGECIVVFTPTIGSDHLIYRMIYPATRRIEKVTIDYDFHEHFVVSTCIVEDTIYFFLERFQQEAIIEMLSFNLQTWTNELIELSNAPVVSSEHDTIAITHENNIFFMAVDTSPVFIFNTVTKAWTEVEETLACDYLRIVNTNVVDFNGEVFFFRNLLDSNKWTDIFHCNLKKWRKNDLALPSITNNSNCFTEYFAYHRKLFVIKNSNNAMNRLYASRNEEPLPNSDVMDIYELNFSPSLERLCLIAVFKHPLLCDELPEFMQNELKRLIK
ncbi:hypothetical protein CHUAL_014095 [Chamberlinius hualienensis]